LRRADHSSKESYQLSIRVRLRNPIKRRPRPDTGWSAIEEEEEEEEEELLVMYTSADGFTARNFLFCVAAKKVRLHDLDKHECHCQGLYLTPGFHGQ
jgi:hypothetical protein